MKCNRIIGERDMKAKRRLKVMMFMWLMITAIFTGITQATIVDITMETDKSIYQLGEDVVVSVTAVNPTNEPVQLGFGSSLQATYQMDGVFDWTEGKVFAQSLTYVNLPAFGSYRWDLIHGSKERELYPLDLGIHIVVGEVVGYGTSSPIEFSVVPEPSIILLISIGSIYIRLVKRY